MESLINCDSSTPSATWFDLNNRQCFFKKNKMPWDLEELSKIYMSQSLILSKMIFQLTFFKYLHNNKKEKAKVVLSSVANNLFYIYHSVWTIFVPSLIYFIF